MQVLTVLAEAAGGVVTRDLLFRRCWGNPYVGDDSLNRAIAGVRRLASSVAADSFTIENIPRTGYRLTEKTSSDGDAATEPSNGGLRVTRRWVAVGGLSAAAAGGVALWTTRSTPPDPAARLIEHGEQALRLAMPDSNAQGVAQFQQAVAIEPDNARAWGLLALALRNVAENAPPDKVMAAVQGSELAVRRSLALDPNDGNALAAQAMLRPYFGEWGAAEDRLRAVLAKAPNNFAARSDLEILLQSVGRSRDSWKQNVRVIALDPLAPVPQYRLAIKHWIFGRPTESDQAIDRALQTWPRHPGVWNTRLWLFAVTGRPEAALAMIEDDATRPPTMKPPALAVWRTSLKALATRATPDIAAARDANAQQSKRSPGYAVNAILVLSALGEIDTAFAVADGYLLRSGRLIGALHTGGGQMPVNDQQWRKTMMLFVPVTAPMRADPRFGRVCDGTGLTRYWRERGIVPDYKLNLTP